MLQGFRDLGFFAIIARVGSGSIGQVLIGNFRTGLNWLGSDSLTVRASFIPAGLTAAS